MPDIFNHFFPAPFVDKTFSSYVLTDFAENQLTGNMWVFSLVFYSLPSVSVCIFMAVPCCFGFYSFAICFEVRYCNIAKFFAQDC
jgi:hypothetical protein